MTDQPTLGALADRLYKHRSKRLALQKRVDALKAEEQFLEATCLQSLRTEKLESARGRVGVITVSTTTQYGVVDWDKVLDWIRRRKAWDLLHRRVAQDACRERAEAGVAIDGLDVVRVTKVAVTKAGKR